MRLLNTGGRRKPYFAAVCGAVCAAFCGVLLGGAARLSPEDLRAEPPAPQLVAITPASAPEIWEAVSVRNARLAYGGGLEQAGFERY